MGAGDQGMMFGYACTETPEPHAGADQPRAPDHADGGQGAQGRRRLPSCAPTASARCPCSTWTASPRTWPPWCSPTSTRKRSPYKELQEALIESVIRKAIPAELLDKNTVYHINPTGRFVIGGPHGDTGLTGRKIIVDTYGGMSRHGGGAFSGKDPTKVDRSASYMARYVAKNIVAAGLCERCEVQVAYAIGIAKPVSLFVSTFDTGKVPDEKIEKAVSEVFDLTPQGIIRTLDLLRPIYRETSNYGHFGREGFTWEKTDKVEAIKAKVG